MLNGTAVAGGLLSAVLTLCRNDDGKMRSLIVLYPDKRALISQLECVDPDRNDDDANHSGRAIRRKQRFEG